MPEVRRTVRSTYRDDYESDDDRSISSHHRGGGESYRTVQRYRVTPGRVEEIEDDRHSSRVEVLPPRAERIEIDRRIIVEPDRPRSAVELRPRSTIVERYVEREPVREPEREREREHIRTTVYAERDNIRREPESARPWESRPRPWEELRESDTTIEKRIVRRDDPYERETDVRIEKRVERDAYDRETDVRIEKRVERRDDPYERETDVRIEKRVERREEPYDREIYQRETEYYDRPEPPPAPIIIRQRAEPQQIIVQEAPAPLPIILPVPEQQYQVIRREEVRPEPRRYQEDEYYYRKDVREVGRGRGREDDMAITEYDRRAIRPRDSVSDRGYSDEESYMIKKKIIRRDGSSSPNRKRHLAEGALAGAGVAALLTDHKKRQGAENQHTGRNVVGGAALGAIGAEVITRARSRYRENHSESRSRSRSSSRHHKLKTAIGLAAAGLAAAAAAKYVSNRRANKEEDGRGRSRTRSASRRRGGGHRGYYSDDSYEEHRTTISRKRSGSRNATIAKAGAATAVVAGIAEHIRNKSRSRKGERSKSRIRTGAEIAGAGLAGAAVAGLYENRKAKEDQARGGVDVTERSSRRRSRSGNSRSRARSVGAYSDPGVDPELGMVQYGTEPVPVYTQQPPDPRGYENDPAVVAAAAGAAYGTTRHHGSRSRRRHRDRSYSSTSDEPRRHSRSRSQSRVRDLATGAGTAAAAAIGINQYKKRKEKKEAARERERRRYEEEETPPENYYARDYHDDYSPSPPHASGGSYYPQQPYVPPNVANNGFTSHQNQSAMHVNQPPIPPYNPADYVNQPPVIDPYTGHPPAGSAPRPAGDHVSANDNLPRQVPTTNSANALYFPPPPTTPLPDEQLHHANRDSSRNAEEGRISDASTASISPTTSPHRARSVKWGPLSPTSTCTLARVRQNAAESSTHVKDEPNAAIPEAVSSDESYHVPESSHRRRRRRRRRRSSDPSRDRPHQSSKHRRRHANPSRSPSPEVELLPDRFDKEGRPLDRDGQSFPRGAAGDQQEMVEKLTRDFGDVVSGKKNWKDMLRDVVSDFSIAGSSHDGGSEKSPERPKRRKRTDRD